MEGKRARVPFVHFKGREWVDLEEDEGIRSLAPKLPPKATVLERDIIRQIESWEIIKC